MPETVFGYIDQLSSAEFMNTAAGVIIDTVVHVIGESFLDDYYKQSYPDTYPVYSTLTVTGVMTAISVGIWLYTRGKAGYEFVQYIIAGFMFVELVQILDLIRVHFTAS